MRYAVYPHRWTEPADSKDFLSESFEVVDGFAVFFEPTPGQFHSASEVRHGLERAVRTLEEAKEIIARHRKEHTPVYTEEA